MTTFAPPDQPRFKIGGVIAGITSFPSIASAVVSLDGWKDIANGEKEKGAVKILAAGVTSALYSKLSIDALLSAMTGSHVSIMPLSRHLSVSISFNYCRKKNSNHSYSYSKNKGVFMNSVNSSNTQDLILKWTPRMVVAGFAGYYSLGLAYELGIMAAIDRIAIVVFKHLVGTAGIGAAMPSFQWYASWGVRIAAVAGAEIIYDLGEKITCHLYNKIRPAPKLAT